MFKLADANFNFGAAPAPTPAADRVYKFLAKAPRRIPPISAGKWKFLNCFSATKTLSFYLFFSKSVQRFLHQMWCVSSAAQICTRMSNRDGFLSCTKDENQCQGERLRRRSCETTAAVQSAKISEQKTLLQTALRTSSAFQTISPKQCRND
jgi:hypothetical protein